MIFFIRIVDVGLATIRLIFISRGIRVVSAILGFIEVLVWLVAVSQIMQNLHSPIYYIAYAAGFGMGNFVGVSIERKLSYGNRIVTVITRRDSTSLLQALKHLGHGITVVGGEGESGPVKIIFSVVKKKQVFKVIETVKKFNPNAFYTVEDIRTVNEDSYSGETKKTRFPQSLRKFLIKRK